MESLLGDTNLGASSCQDYKSQKLQVFGYHERGGGACELALALGGVCLGGGSIIKLALLASEEKPIEEKRSP